MVVVVEGGSKNKELDTGGGEGGGVHVDDVVVVGVVDDGVVAAHSDRWEESRWKWEKDSEIPPWFVPVK